MHSGDNGETVISGEVKQFTNPIHKKKPYIHNKKPDEANFKKKLTSRLFNKGKQIVLALTRKGLIAISYDRLIPNPKNIRKLLHIQYVTIMLRHRLCQVGGNKKVELGAVNDLKKSGLKGMDGWPFFIFARPGSIMEPGKAREMLNCG